MDAARNPPLAKGQEPGLKPGDVVDYTGPLELLPRAQIERTALAFVVQDVRRIGDDEVIALRGAGGVWPASSFRRRAGAPEPSGALPSRVTVRWPSDQA
jgi:hypothetical protein